MLVELKSGETLNGLLVNCDTWMNLTLREVVQTSADGDKFMRLPEIYVRGSTVSTHRKSGHVAGLKLTMRRSSTCGCRMRSSRSSRSSRPRTRRKEADAAACTREETTGATGEAGVRAVAGGAVDGAAVVTTTLERATRGGFVEQDKRCNGMNRKRRWVGWRTTRRRDAVTIRLVDDRPCIQMNTIDTPAKLWSY